MKDAEGNWINDWSHIIIHTSTVLLLIEDKRYFVKKIRITIIVIYPIFMGYLKFVIIR